MKRQRRLTRKQRQERFLTVRGWVEEKRKTAAQRLNIELNGEETPPVVKAYPTVSMSLKIIHPCPAGR